MRKTIATIVLGLTFTAMPLMSASADTKPPKPDTSTPVECVPWANEATSATLESAQRLVTIYTQQNTISAQQQKIARQHQRIVELRRELHAAQR